MRVQPLLNFDGRCEAVLNHYAKAFAAKVTGMMRWKDCPDNTSRATPGNEEIIADAAFGVGKATRMAMDRPDPSGEPEFKGNTLSMVVANRAGAKRLFDAMFAAAAMVATPSARSIGVAL